LKAGHSRHEEVGGAEMRMGVPGATLGGCGREGAGGRGRWWCRRELGGGGWGGGGGGH